MPAWRQDLRRRLLMDLHPGDSQRAQAQRTLIPWIEEHLRPDLFVTIQFNEALTIQRARDRLHVFAGEVEKIWVCQRFHKKPPEERSLYIGFLEGESSPHWHILWRLPARVRDHSFWKLQMTLIGLMPVKCAPHGTIDVQDLRGNVQLFSVLDYCLKHYYPDHPERMVISGER